MDQQQQMTQISKLLQSAEPYTGPQATWILCRLDTLPPNFGPLSKCPVHPSIAQVRY